MPLRAKVRRTADARGGARPTFLIAMLLCAQGGCTSAPVVPERDPIAAAGALARGRVAWTRGAQADALSCYEEAAGLDPWSAALHAQYGHALLIVGDLPRARAELTLARALDPDAVMGAVDLAELDLREHRSDQAVRTLVAVVEKDPGEERALQLLHPLLLYLGRVPDGLAIFTRARERRPELAFVHEAQADFFALSGRTDEALAGYRRALALDPRRASAERKAVHLLEQESERVRRSLPAAPHPGVGVPAAPRAPLGSG